MHSMFPFFFSVAPKFDLDLKYMRPITVRAGATINLDASFTATPIPTVTWEKDHQPLGKTYRVTVNTEESGSTLTIRNAERNDSGIYTITAKNKAGEDKSKVEVKVVDRPGSPSGPLHVSHI